MNARASGTAPQPVAEETRMQRARVDLTIATLPIAVWVNPTWAALTVLPFTGLFPIFGAVAWWRIVAILVLQIANSFIAVALYREQSAAALAIEKDPQSSQFINAEGVLQQSRQGIQQALRLLPDLVLGNNVVR